MSVKDLLIALVLAALAAYSVAAARAAWRDPDWQPSPFASLGRARATVAIAVVLVSAAVLMIGVTIASARTGASAHAITVGFGLPGIAGVLVGGALALMLSTSGRPRSLVPPPLRAGVARAVGGVLVQAQAGNGQAAAAFGASNAADSGGSSTAGSAASSPGHPALADRGAAAYLSKPGDPAILATASADGGGVVAVLRSGSGYRDVLRAYKIMIDGQEAGRIRRGQRVDLPVRQGKHDIRLTIDWCASPVVPVQVDRGEVARLYCEPNGGPARQAMYAAASNPGQYIRLVRVPA